MRIRYARLTTPGPVRPNNEDWIDFWESPDPLVRDKQGSVALLADGVGGLGHGEVASKLAIEEALTVFKEAPVETVPATLLRQMFNRACAKVHDTALSQRLGNMATTLVVSIIRNRVAHIAHVGDSRAYLIRSNTIQRLTKDHVATALPVKLGLMLERQAMASPQRSQLTRNLGVDPVCMPDFTSVEIQHGDFILHCTDGLHAFVLDDEICNIVSKNHPFDACKKLSEQAEKRGSDDNLSLQLLQINDFETVAKKKAADPTQKAASATGDMSVGQLLDGRFELTDLIARSNMASIFRADDRQNGQSVAVKVPLMALESDIAGFDRFKREEEIGLKLNNPSILKFIKVENKSRPYIVMEFLEGETLNDYMKRLKVLPEPEAAKITARICEALEYMHKQGITHRDLKPHNVMLCRDGSIRLMDFGIARAEGARRLTFVGFSPVMGTPDYMSPEQVKGKRGDHRSDLYSLGAMLYEMVTGSTPFQGESPYVVMNARVTGDPEAPRKLNHQLTPVMEEIILHALERDPAKRYGDAAEMRRELDNYESVVLTNRYERLRAPQPWSNTRRMAPIIIGIIALWILSFFGLWWFLKGKH
ncbi:MAG TPA: protein kinase [Opitutales bacterium]|jgi:serine/threonine protein phosphatase PrpC|nr:protein kinase [Opitutales bacterium]